MKALAIASLFGATLASSAVAQNLTELDKQLNIMSGVIDTALKQDTRKDGVRYRSIEATYLAKQGVIFTINTGGRSMMFDFDFSDLMSVLPTAPEAPESHTVTVVTDGMHIETDGDYEFVFEQDWEDTADRVVRQVERIVRKTDEKLREFRSDRREIEWELRELERRNRDLEFELRGADAERKRQIESEMKEIKSTIDGLQTREKELQDYAKELAEEKKAELEKQREMQQQAYKTFLANFEGSVGDTLCSFGAGLRELPDDEHISFILKNFGKGDDGKAQDRVYIFSKKSVKSCVTERIKPSELLSKAEVYAF
ncbi:hypothetical protein FJ444_21110 [Aestuariibacter sp. GS-14]|uniref:hypothetical protein n=1 Tax=Aestuariibacter sp. GS-14 TaxID=2590670 RepID=UPI00112D4501|nr:hypothetical protein [Aestuariibacter sp. GS-14]TPV52339.1 hypothetical protein FJ444_21110 [Aestuariibacter sp. GS-14]